MIKSNNKVKQNQFINWIIRLKVEDYLTNKIVIKKQQKDEGKTRQIY